MITHFLTLSNEFAETMEGHYTTHEVGWLDYVLIIVSTIAVLISVYYTFKYLLPNSKHKQEEPKIKYEILDWEDDE